MVHHGEPLPSRGAGRPPGAVAFDATHPSSRASATSDSSSRTSTSTRWRREWSRTRRHWLGAGTPSSSSGREILWQMSTRRSSCSVRDEPQSGRHTCGCSGVAPGEVDGRGCREAAVVGTSRGRRRAACARGGRAAPRRAGGQYGCAAHTTWAVDDYLAVGCRFLGGEPIAWRGRSKGILVTRMRELMPMVGVEVYGLRVNELAAAWGMNAGSASRLLWRALDRLREDEDYRRQRLELEARLAEIASTQMPANRR